MKKTCKTCKQSKDVIDFYKAQYGYHPNCKECHRKISKERYDANKIEIRKDSKIKYSQLSDQKKKEKALKTRFHYQTIDGRFEYWKRNAARRGLVFSISIEDIKSLPMQCFYTGEKLSLIVDKKNTISLDRIDSNLGYVKGNICLCCVDINLMKNNMPVNDFYDWCKKVVDHKK